MNRRRHRMLFGCAAIGVVAILAHPAFAGLDVKIQEAKVDDGRMQLTASVPGEPTRNSVATWWCQRAPRIPGAEHLRMEIRSDSATFQCSYAQWEGNTTSCQCGPDAEALKSPFTLEKIWRQDSPKGATFFLRIAVVTDKKEAKARDFARNLLTLLQGTGAYRASRWEFLFDSYFDPERDRRFSLGRIVLNDRSFDMLSEGSWQKPEPKQPAFIDACALTRGNVYTISKETPLMPEMDPKDPMEAMTHIRYVPAGSKVQVVVIYNRGHGDTWYGVHVRLQANGTILDGYINCVALLGQELRLTSSF